MSHPASTSSRPRHSALLLPVLALAAATMLASAGPAAAGSGYGQLIVNPGTAAPGQTVSILGVCPNNGSTPTGVRSSAFAGGAASITIGSENFSGKATISGNIAPGTYTVTAECGSGSPSVNLTVTAAAPKPSSAPSTTRAPQSTPAMPPPSHTSAPQPSGAPTRTGGAGGMPASSSPSTTTTTSPTAATSAAAASATATATATAAATATTQAPAVTSTGVIRVGLAGHSSPLSGMLSPLLIAAAFLIACAAGFLLRRRRHSTGSHE